MKIKGLYLSDWIALIVSAFLPRQVKYYAMLDWFDWLDGVPAEEMEFTITAPGYTVEYKRTEPKE